MNTSDMNKGEKAAGEFIIASSHATKLLDLEEKVLHQMSFLVFVPVTVPRIRLIGLGRDTEICSAVSQKLAESKLSIGFVGQNSCVGKIKMLHKLFRHPAVMYLTGGKHDRDRVPQSVHSDMDFRISAASAYPDALVLLLLLESFFSSLFAHLRLPCAP